jgi:hypothetical protein
MGLRILTVRLDFDTVKCLSWLRSMALCQTATGQYNLEPTLHFKNQGMVCCIIAAPCRVGNLPLAELADLAEVKQTCFTTKAIPCSFKSIPMNKTNESNNINKIIC